MSGVGAWFEGGVGRGGVQGSFVPRLERLDLLDGMRGVGAWFEGLGLRVGRVHTEALNE